MIYSLRSACAQLQLCFMLTGRTSQNLFSKRVNLNFRKSFTLRRARQPVLVFATVHSIVRFDLTVPSTFLGLTSRFWRRNVQQIGKCASGQVDFWRGWSQIGCGTTCTTRDLAAACTQKGGERSAAALAELNRIPTAYSPICKLPVTSCDVPASYDVI